MKSFRTLFLVSLLALAAVPSSWAQVSASASVEVAGVRFEPTTAVGNAKLQLNGAGIRYKAVFRVYAAALYLGAKAATPDAVYAAPGAKRVHVVMLRDIDANELGKLFTDGMQKNASREEFGKSIPGTLKLAEIFAAKKRLVAGDALMKIWLGASPADWQLKDALLGQSKG